MEVIQVCGAAPSKKDKQEGRVIMRKKSLKQDSRPEMYEAVFGEVASLVEAARRSAVRSINSIMTAAYWLIGRHIVEFEQGGSSRAGYGEELLVRLSADLAAKFGRGFSPRSLQNMRLFYLAYPPETIWQTLSAKSDGSADAFSWMLSGANIPGEKQQTASAILDLAVLATCFPLPWSVYVRLLTVTNEHARRFYGEETLRGGWSVRQLDRQIETQFYERTALSRNKTTMMRGGKAQLPEDAFPVEQELKDPFVLEFLGLRDEYSESDLEEALVRHLQSFLLELGGDFCFVGQQKRLRVGDEWYRVDLVFFHRRLRSLVIIDLKIGKFTPADAGQMHLYLNYAREHWMQAGENPPVGLILCAQKDAAVARYALDGLPNKVMAAEYRTMLPDEEVLAREIRDTRLLLKSDEASSRHREMDRPD